MRRSIKKVAKSALMSREFAESQRAERMRSGVAWTQRILAPVSEGALREFGAQLVRILAWLGALGAGAMAAMAANGWPI